LAGEKNLENLLCSMSPVLTDGDYVFCTVKNSKYGDYAKACPIASFAETEGLTLVLLKETAERFDLSFEGVFRCITLGVHSSLEAVGLTAAVAGELADRAIGILSNYNNR
jgi:hypothetical protein